MWLYSPVCVGPGRKPRRPVFSKRGSYNILIQRMAHSAHVIPLQMTRREACLDTKLFLVCRGDRTPLTRRQSVVNGLSYQMMRSANKYTCNNCSSRALLLWCWRQPGVWQRRGRGPLQILSVRRCHDRWLQRRGHAGTGTNLHHFIIAVCIFE